MNIKMIGLLVMALLAGAVLPIQAGFGIQLGKTAQQPLFGAFASFLVGAVGLFILLLMIKFDFQTIPYPNAGSMWYWSAGILAGFYVCVVFLVAPKLGTALTFSLVVVGQMILSLVLDHYGLFDLPMKQVNWQRVLGMVCLIVGVVLIRKF